MDVLDEGLVMLNDRILLKAQLEDVLYEGTLTEDELNWLVDFIQDNFEAKEQK